MREEHPIYPPRIFTLTIPTDHRRVEELRNDLRKEGFNQPMDLRPSEYAALRNRPLPEDGNPYGRSND